MLLDLDGVLYVEDEPVPGAGAGGRADAGRRVDPSLRHEHDVPVAGRHTREAERLGFDVGTEELITPALLALQHCRERGHRRVPLLMTDEVKADFAELEEAER